MLAVFGALAAYTPGATAVFNALASTVGAQAVFQQHFGGAAWFSGTSCNTPANHLTKAQLDPALPPLTLVFPAVGGGSFSVQLPATDSYLLPQDDALGNAYYCPGIEPGSLTIFGANAMHTLITIFDRQRSEIGFAPQQGCPVLAGETVAAEATAPAARAMPPYRHRPMAYADMDVLGFADTDLDALAMHDERVGADATSARAPTSGRR